MKKSNFYRHPYSRVSILHTDTAKKISRKEYASRGKLASIQIAKKKNPEEKLPGGRIKCK